MQAVAVRARPGFLFGDRGFLGILVALAESGTRAAAMGARCDYDSRRGRR